MVDKIINRGSKTKNASIINKIEIQLTLFGQTVRMKEDRC